MALDAAADPFDSLVGLHLRELWSHALAQRASTVRAPVERSVWMRWDVTMRGLEISLQEGLAMLYAEAPAYAAFQAWILAKNGGRIDPARIARIDAALRGDPGDASARETAAPVFTADEVAQWDDQGYVVLHDAVPPEGCAAAEDAIWSFLGMDRDDSATWYAGPQGHSIWVPLLHHPALWANRRAPRVRRAFEQLWNRSDMWVTVDQVGFNPPERPGWNFPGPYLHWDASLALPIPFDLQALLYLVDVAPDQGAFTCVPGFHRRIEQWLRDLPPGAEPRTQDLYALGAVPIAGRAGDLVIWHHALPHGSSPNRATRPRIVQYLKMHPSAWEQSATWV